jgi:predicted RNA-binding protein YlqC (UPF0109 family)
VSDEYVAGDINTIDEAPGDYQGDDANVERAATAERVLAYIASSMADEPDAVSVDVSDQGNKVLLSLNVAPGDMGRVIGRRGRTAQALRTLVAAAGSRDGVTTSVDIVD